jgi:hypothetical protein
VNQPELLTQIKLPLIFFFFTCLLMLPTNGTIFFPPFPENTRQGRTAGHSPSVVLPRLTVLRGISPVRVFLAWYLIRTHFLQTGVRLSTLAYT